jgi:hypothetical protein
MLRCHRKQECGHCRYADRLVIGRLANWGSFTCSASARVGLDAVTRTEISAFGAGYPGRGVIKTLLLGARVGSYLTTTARNTPYGIAVHSTKYLQYLTRFRQRDSMDSFQRFFGL